MSCPPFLYIIGIPGSGKTAAVHMAMAGSIAIQERDPVLHVRHTWKHGTEDEIAILEIGSCQRFSRAHDTDGLSYAAQPGVVDWLSEAQPGPILAEGDRLANDGFFRAVLAAGYDLSIVLLDVSEELAEERRIERGSDHNASWLKGRATKVLNLAHGWAKYVTVIDGSQPLEDVALELREQAVFAAVREMAKEKRR